MHSDDFLDYIYHASLKQPTLKDCPLPLLEQLRDKKRAELYRILALDRLSQMPVAHEFRIEEVSPKEGYSIRKGTACYLPKLEADYYLLEPDHCIGTVIFLHGHGNGCAECLNKDGREDYHHNFPLRLVESGYRVYMPELIGFGEAVCQGYQSDNPRDQGCYANAGWLLLAGIPLIGVRVYQVLSLLEHLLSREAAPPVLIGISGGGTVTMYTAALTRLLKGIGICCYANTFRSSILSMRHCIDNYVPGILAVGEEPELISLACPTPILLSCGESDRIYPVYAAREAEGYIREIYGRERVEQRVTSAYFAKGHEMDNEAILQWLHSIYESEDI